MRAFQKSVRFMDNALDFGCPRHANEHQDGVGGQLTMARELGGTPFDKLFDRSPAMVGHLRGILKRNAEEHVGSWPSGTTSEIADLEDWARSKNLDAVVWTALPRQLDTAKGVVPMEVEVMNYVRGLTGAKRRVAEQYVRRTPRQIDTAFRRLMEAEFNWDPADDEN